MAFVLNLPLFSILLLMLGAVICLPLGPRAARTVSLSCIGAVVMMSAALLAYTVSTGESYTYLMGHFPAPFGNEIRYGPLEALMALFFCFILFLSVSGGLRDLFADLPPSRLHYFFIMANMLLAAMLAIIYTNDLFTAYIFIDIITICACTVVMIKPGGKTLIATAVYLIMSLIGSSMVLLSIALLYGVTGHLLMPNLFLSVQDLMAAGQYQIPLFVQLALLVAGLGIKSALFPFHVWLPDAHASATTAASSILSGLIIKCYLVLMIKVFYRVYGLETVAVLRVTDILLAFGACGVVYGSVRALRQRHIKRMLSYASVAQIGFICMGIGLNSNAGMVAACFHILAHAGAKSMLFCAAGGLADASGHRKDFNALRGAARRDPLAGAAFGVGALSMVGLPLFSGFISKLYLAGASLERPLTAVVVMGCIVMSTVLNAMYYLPALACILAKPGPEEAAPEPVDRPLSYRATLVAYMAVCVFMGLFSGPVIRVIRQGLGVFGM